MDNIHRESETLPSVFAMDLKTPRLAPLRIWELSWTNCPIKRQHRPVIYLWLAWLNSSAPLMKIQASACVYKQQWQSRLRSQLQTAITFDGELSQIRGLACINLWQILHPNNLEWSVSRGFPTFWHFSHVRISSILDHSYEKLNLTTKKKNWTATTRLREPPRPGVFEKEVSFFFEYFDNLVDFWGFGNHNFFKWQWQKMRSRHDW
jgi:hypothetical protein